MDIAHRSNARLILQKHSARKPDTEGASNRASSKIDPNPTDPSRIIPIDRLPFTLGRSAERDLCLPSPQVSRAHALIDRDADGYFLRDTGSRHGTFVNGLRITTTRLRSQDIITLGTPEHALLFDSMPESNSTRSLLAQFSKAGLSAAPRAASELDTLSLFLKAAQSLHQHGARADVLATMLEYAIRLTGAERGFVFLGATADTFQFECGQDRSGAPIFEPTSISRSILHDAAGSRLAFLFSDAAEDTFPGSVQNPAQNPAQTRESLILAAIRNVVAIPLRSQSSSALLGLLYLDSRAATHDFTRTRRDILESIASQAATLFENLRMLDAEREFAVLRKELEIAASIQRQIIPQSLPEFPGVRLSARSIPCAEVGGDFYDVIPLPQGFAAIVGDVCGKGVPAALLASMVQGMFHAQMTTGASLLDAIRSLNTFVCQRAPIEKYVTLAVVLYSKSPTGRARLEVVNGGHVPPVIVRANGQVEAITDGDPPVGLLSFASFHSIPVDLAPGDRILLLSDGITEAENLAGIQFGPEQLEQFVAGANPVESIFAALDQFCAGTHPQDDQTILTIDCTA